MADKKDEVKVVMEFSVNGETIQTMSSAWEKSMGLPIPVEVKFLRLVRKRQ